MPPLLQRLSERRPEALDYLGVSYGITPQLLRYKFKVFEHLYLLADIFIGFGSALALFRSTSGRLQMSSRVNIAVLWYEA